MLFFHVLISYGPKPLDSIGDHPEAALQLEVFRQVRVSYPDQQAKTVFDYARSIHRLYELPKMLTLLKLMKKAEAGVVFVDDLSRYFNRTLPSDREALLEELSLYGKHVFSCGHNKRMIDLSSDETKVLLLLPAQRRNRLKPTVERDTKNARLASIKTRSDRSIGIGRKIKSVQDELLDTYGKVTLQMVADKANEGGMQTATGKQWTRQTVGKALKAAGRSESK